MALVTAMLRNYSVLGTESLTVTNGGAAVVTASGSYLSDRMDISNMIIAIGLEVTNVSAGDGAIDARLEGSMDGASGWTVVDSTASLDLDTTGLNSVFGSLSAVGFAFPYYRVTIFTDGTDIVDPCIVTVTVASRHVSWERFYTSEFLTV